MGLSPDALYNAICLDVGFGSDLPLRDLAKAGLSYKAFACSYLRQSVIRKWIPKDARKADLASLDSFTAANNRCKAWSYPLEEWEIDRVFYGELRRVLDDFFHPSGDLLVPSLYDLNTVARPGPGVSVGALGTSYYTKFFSSQLSTTSKYLYLMYKHYTEQIPCLADAECQRYAEYGSANVVKGSRSSFVPKTSSTSRMICVEPLLNSYYQLGLATVLEKRLKTFFGIDLGSQPCANRALAQEGSIDGSFATIDLSSASDSLSLGFCEAFLPKWFFELLLVLRSPVTKIGNKDVPLYMMSTMGNGFTFPLQTIVFSAILKTAVSLFGRSGHDTWECFGDDLICPTSIVGRVIHYLDKLGFVTNVDKTFFEGSFRESCGADWYFGQPVRPVFIRKLDRPQDYLVAVNQLNEWSAYTGIPLRNSVRLLLSHIGFRFLNPVPYESALDSGLRVPLAICKPYRDRNGSFKYRTWDRRPNRLRIIGDTIHGIGRLREIAFNPSGLWCSFLWGELVSSQHIPTAPSDVAYISVRHDRYVYYSKPRCSPRWDYIPHSSLTNGVRLDWQQWVTAVMSNLPLLPFERAAVGRLT